MTIYRCILINNSPLTRHIYNNNIKLRFNQKSIKYLFFMSVLKVVELLLKHGALVDAPDWDQRTALRAAAWGGHEDIVKALLQHGADVNRTDDEGRTALIAAAYMGHSEIVEHLLNFGAEIDHADSDGRTALSVAALCVPSNHGYAKVSNIISRTFNSQLHYNSRTRSVPLPQTTIVLT